MSINEFDVVISYASGHRFWVNCALACLLQPLCLENLIVNSSYFEPLFNNQLGKLKLTGTKKFVMWTLSLLISIWFEPMRSLRSLVSFNRSYIFYGVYSCNSVLLTACILSVKGEQPNIRKDLRLKKG